MWLAGIAGTLLPTLLGYGMYALQTIKTRRGLVSASFACASWILVANSDNWML